METPRTTQGAEGPFLTGLETPIVTPETAAAGHVSQAEITAPATASTGPPYRETSTFFKKEHTPGERAGYFVAAHAIEGSPIIRHYATHDTVINTNHPDRHLVTEATVAAAAGIPDSWAVMPVSSSRSEGPHFVDSVEQPRMFAHERHDVTTESYRQHQRDEREQQRLELITPEQARLNLRGDQVNHSVLHEMEMAKTVQEIIDEQLSHRIKLMGYRGLKVVTPLIALSQHDTGTKTVIYPYYEATNNVGLRGRYRNPQTAAEHNMRLFSVSAAIMRILNNEGIAPYLLSSDRMMLGYNGFGGELGMLPLYLTGTSHYQHKSPATRAVKRRDSNT
jgi:hypothetical protein